MNAMWCRWRTLTRKKLLSDCTQLHIGAGKIVFPLLPMALHVPVEKLLNPIFSIWEKTFWRMVSSSIVGEDHRKCDMHRALSVIAIWYHKWPDGLELEKLKLSLLTPQLDCLVCQRSPDLQMLLWMSGSSMHICVVGESAFSFASSWRRPRLGRGSELTAEGPSFLSQQCGLAGQERTKRTEF